MHFGVPAAPPVRGMTPHFAPPSGRPVARASVHAPLPRAAAYRPFTHPVPVPPHANPAHLAPQQLLKRRWEQQELLRRSRASAENAARAAAAARSAADAARAAQVRAQQIPQYVPMPPVAPPAPAPQPAITPGSPEADLTPAQDAADGGGETVPPPEVDHPKSKLLLFGVLVVGAGVGGVLYMRHRKRKGPPKAPEKR